MHLGNHNLFVFLYARLVVLILNIKKGQHTSSLQLFHARNSAFLAEFALLICAVFPAISRELLHDCFIIKTIIQIGLNSLISQCHIWHMKLWIDKSFYISCLWTRIILAERYKFVDKKVFNWNLKAKSRICAICRQKKPLPTELYIYCLHLP